MLNKEIVLKSLGQCARCRQCRMVCEVPIAQTMLPVCPTGEFFKFDTYYGTGRVTLAKKVLLNMAELDQSIVNAVYSCTLCGNCLQQCPITGFDPMSATFVLREMAVEQGKADKIYVMPSNKIIDVKIDEDPDSTTALFLGTEANSDADTVKKVAKALNASGLTFRVLKADAGEYLQRKGDTNAFEAKRAENIAAFKSMGLKKIIAHDPMTYKALSDYGMLEDGIDVEFYLNLIVLNMVKPNAQPGKGKKAAYHDSSYLGRYMGEYELPRNIIMGLGYELTEMKRTKESAMSSAAYPDGIKAMADMCSQSLLEEAAEVGAEVLFVTGRNSTAQLKETAGKIGSKIVVKDILEDL